MQGFVHQAQANQALAGRAGASGSRQTSSHGDQSGQRGVQPGEWNSIDIISPAAKLFGVSAMSPQDI
jgi:hypothetical protein